MPVAKVSPALQHARASHPEPLGCTAGGRVHLGKGAAGRRAHKLHGLPRPHQRDPGAEMAVPQPRSECLGWAAPRAPRPASQMAPSFFLLAEHHCAEGDAIDVGQHETNQGACSYRGSLLWPRVLSRAPAGACCTGSVALVGRCADCLFSSVFLCQEPLPETLVAVMQEVWAGNGNMISRQYAGTDAMKVRRVKRCHATARALPRKKKHCCSTVVALTPCCPLLTLQSEATKKKKSNVRVLGREGRVATGLALCCRHVAHCCCCCS